MPPRGKKSSKQRSSGSSSSRPAKRPNNSKPAAAREAADDLKGDLWDIEVVIRNSRFFLPLEKIGENYRTYDPKSPVAQPIWEPTQGVAGLPTITDYFPQEFCYMFKAPPPLPRDQFYGPSFDGPTLSLAPHPPPDQRDGRAEALRLQGPPPSPLRLPATGRLPTKVYDGWSLPSKAYTVQSVYFPDEDSVPGAIYPQPDEVDPPEPYERRLATGWRTMDRFPREVREAMAKEREHAQQLIQQYDPLLVEDLPRSFEAEERLHFELLQPPPRFVPVPNPTRPMPLLSRSTTISPTTRSVDLNCLMLYTEHTETLSITGVDRTFRVADIPFHPDVKARIEAFLSAYHLPPFCASDYDYFFCPNATQTQLASRWAKQKNAALVIHPAKWGDTSRFPSYCERRRQIPKLVREVEELVAKGRCQLGLLRVLNEVMQELWEDRGLRMYPHQQQWAEFDTAPNALCSVMLRLLRTAEAEVARLVERRARPPPPPHPIYQQLKDSTALLAEKRAHLAALQQELAGLRTENANLESELTRIGPGPDAAEVEETRRRYHTFAQPMFKIWGRTMVEYARLQAKQDLQPRHNIRREKKNSSRWANYNEDVRTITARPDLMQILGRHGMDIALLMFTRLTRRGGYQNLVDNAAGAAAHVSDMEAMATAVTSKHLLDVHQHLRAFFQFMYPGTDPEAAAAAFESRYKDNQAWVDLI